MVERIADDKHERVAQALYEAVCHTRDTLRGEKLPRSFAEILRREYGDSGVADAANFSARLAVVREIIKEHRHTEECFKYAAKTAARGGGAHCIAQCADSHREALAEIDKEKA